MNAHNHSARQPYSPHLCTQSCPTLYEPLDCDLPGSSVHRIFQARILEWVAVSSSRGSSQPMAPASAGRFFTLSPLGSPHHCITDEKTEAQRSEAQCPPSHSESEGELWDSHPGPSDSKIPQPVPAAVRAVLSSNRYVSPWLCFFFFLAAL